MALGEDDGPRGLSDDLITTDEAAALTNRSTGAIRRCVSSGSLQYEGFNDQRRPLLSRAKVLAWCADHPSQPRPSRKTWLETLAALRFLGPATPPELAAYLDLNVGNVRKHLRILIGRAEVERLSDGQWAATHDIAQGRVRQDDTGAWYLADDELDGPPPARIEPSPGAAERVTAARGAA